MPTERLTMQYLVLPRTRDITYAYDALMMGTGNSPPSAVILDFMYGAAAYKCWHSGAAIDQVMKERYEDKYRNIPTLISEPSDDRGEEDAESDPQDKDHRPSGSKQRKEHYSEGLLRAMDDVLALSMFIKGNTRESLAAERQKREELAEARAQEAGRLKAQQWVNATWPSVCSLSPYFPNYKTEHQSQGH